MADSLWYFRNTGCPQETEEYTAGHGPGCQRHHTRTNRTTLTNSLDRSVCCRLPPPCAVPGRCLLHRLGLDSYTSGSSCSVRPRRLLSILTRMTNKTTCHPLGKVKCCIPGTPGMGQGMACPHTWVLGCCKHASGSECPCCSLGCTVTRKSRLTMPR